MLYIPELNTETIPVEARLQDSPPYQVVRQP